MRILITGGQGQLGSALQRVLNTDTVFAPSHEQLDITNFAQVRQYMEEVAPDLVIHAAALTDTRLCEDAPDLAYQVNVLGTWHIANAASARNLPLVYISTNEVFDGKRCQPYLEYDPPAPINAYGRSKWMGEQIVQSLTSRWYIVRTAWLYSESSRNFPARILRAAEQGPLKVVQDEISTPTLASDLAEALAHLIRAPLYGIYHLTNDGACSRFEWAQAILELAGKHDIPLIPTTLAEFNPYPPKPPSTVLQNSAAAISLGIRLRPWRDALAALFAQRHESI